MHKGVAAFALIAVCVGTVEAQRAWEGQAHALVTLVPGSEREANAAARRFVGAGGGVGLRTSGRLRASAAVSVGDAEGRLAIRPEAVVTFLLNPYKAGGVTPYAGGGLAAVFASGGGAEYLILVIGMETNPGRASGFFAEGGVGGGVRLAAGWRVRSR